MSSSRSITWSDVTITPSFDHATPLAGMRRRALTITVEAAHLRDAFASASESSVRTVVPCHFNLRPPIRGP
jgi:hypothetical protein